MKESPQPPGAARQPTGQAAYLLGASSRFVQIIRSAMVKFNAPLGMQKVGEGFLKMFASKIEDDDLIEGLQWFTNECMPYILYGEFIEDDARNYDPVEGAKYGSDNTED